MINRTLRIGGVERKIADIATFLTQSGELGRRKVFLLLNDTRPEDPDEAVFFDAVAISNVHVLSLARGGLNRALPFWVFVLWKTFVLRPDAMLAFLRRPALIAVFTKAVFWWRSIRVVIGEDCLTSRALQSEIRNRALRRLMHSLVRTVYPLANVIVSPSAHAKQDLLDHFAVPAHKVVVNRNWVDTTAAEVSRSTEYDVIYAGRVDEIKNIPLLVTMIRVVVKKLPNIRVCIVGAGNDFENAVAAAENNNLMGNIAFVGFQRDVGRYLARARIFCMASDHEGVPIAALEAMAHGLPIVTTAYPGVDELVVSGDTGLVCDTEQAYCAAVIQLLTNCSLAERMGARARQRAKSHHSLKNLEHLLALVYNSARPPATPIRVD